MRKKNKVLEVIALDIWKESSTRDDRKFTQHQQNTNSNTSAGKAAHLVPIGISAPWPINTIMLSIKTNPTLYENSYTEYVLLYSEWFFTEWDLLLPNISCR
jgi:hypothetical protein